MNVEHLSARLGRTLKWTPYYALAYVLIYVSATSYGLLLGGDSAVEYFLSMPDTVPYQLFLLSLVVLCLAILHLLYRRMIPLNRSGH
ncbi:MAG TPA: hypothetical protein VFJ06_00505 [Halococcus sp.]|nr:hypothetical protein [Halococcus sp.]